MSLSGHFLMPADGKKYKTKEEALLAWKKGVQFTVANTEYPCSVADCAIGDSIVICYQWPDMSKMAGFVQTIEEVKALITNHIIRIKGNKLLISRKKKAE